MKNWEILQKELAIYGVQVVDKEICIDLKSNTKATCGKLIGIIKKELDNESDLFYQYIEKTLKLLYEGQPTEAEVGIDDTRIKLFISSLKRFCELFYLISGKKIHNIYLSRDITEYSKEVIETLPDYLASLDLLYRSCSTKRYKIKLLRCFRAGENKTNRIKLKTAAGVNAPWGRMDLPLLERTFPYSDIEEEMQGKRDDIKRQHRYQKGFEAYNNDGRVGEGHYWREMRIEPFLYSDRFEESPYVSLKSGTWR